MRFLSLLCCLIWGSLTAQSSSDDTSHFHNELYNYAFPLLADSMDFSVAKDWSVKKVIVDDQSRIIDSYKSISSHMFNHEEPGYSIGGYSLMGRDRSFFIESFPNGGFDMKNIEYVLSKPEEDSARELLLHEFENLKIWTLPQGVYNYSNEFQGKQYHLSYSGFGVQYGKQIITVNISLSNPGQQKVKDMAKLIAAFINEMEFNGHRLEFILQDGQWKVDLKEATITKPLPVEKIDAAVNKQMAVRTQGPSIQLGKREKFADKGSYYEYNFPFDALMFSLPSEIFPLKKYSSYPDRHIYQLLNDNRIKSTSYNSTSLIGIGIKDSLIGTSVQLRSSKKGEKGLFDVYSFQGRKWTSEEIRQFFQISQDTFFRKEQSKLVEQVLPDGVAKLYYTPDLKVNITHFPSSFEPGLSKKTVLMLQHNDWLHVLLVGREFAFQVVGLLEKINYRGYQFDFSYEENTLKLDHVFQSGVLPDPENLELLESFRQEYPEKELKVYPPPFSSLKTADVKEEDKENKPEPESPYLLAFEEYSSIGNRVKVEPYSIQVSRDAKSKNALKNRGVTIDFLITPDVPFCFEADESLSKLVMTDDSGKILYGDGRFFPIGEYYKWNPDFEISDSNYPKAGWLEMRDGRSVITTQARSYILPDKKARSIHLKGTLFLKCYTQETEIKDYPSRGTTSSEISFFYENKYFLFKKSDTEEEINKAKFQLITYPGVNISNIEFIDDLGYTLGSFSPNDEFVFEKNAKGLFIVPKMRVTLSKIESLPLSIDQHITLGFE